MEVVTGVSEPIGLVDDTADEPPLVLTADAMEDLRELSRVRWQGWLAPIGSQSGDLRRVPMPSSGELKTREMPLAFLWQRETSHGGDIVNGAVEIGAITYADIRPHPERDGEPWIWGRGFVNLNDDEGLRFAQRLDDGMSRWVSVRFDFAPDYEPDPEALQKILAARGPGGRATPVDFPDWWRLMNVTAEPQPSYDGAVIELVDDLGELEAELADDDEPTSAPAVQAADSHDLPGCAPGEPAPGTCPGPAPATRQLVSTASGTEVTTMSSFYGITTTTCPPDAAGTQPPEDAPGLASGGSGLVATSGGSAGDHSSGELQLVAVVTGDTSLPIASRDTKWNGPEATKRLIEWAGGRFKLDVGKMAKVFLYRDTNMSQKMALAWKFPIADIINGRPAIVPAAVFQAAAVLRGARGGTKIPNADQQQMRAKLNGLYKRLRDQFNDPKIHSPFEAVVHDGHVAAMTNGDTADRHVPPWRRGRSQRKGRQMPAARLTASASSWAAKVAAAVPDEPPREWFTDPGLTGPTKIRVTDEGRILGHIAAWNSRHAAYPDVPPPRNRDKTYSKFHRHPVRVAGGGVVKTGPLATGGHTSTDPAVSMQSVQAHYDDPRFVVGDVVCGEDEHGIWVSGALRPGCSPFQVMLADRYSFSGDWRHGELLAACSVSVPGFHLDADDEVQALTAAASNAGVEDLPVVAEATPELVAAEDGTPAVLIAAGVIVDEELDEGGDAFTAAIDGLGNWLSGELAALRAEIGMGGTAVLGDEQVLAQLKNQVSTELTALRAELGLPAAATAEAGTAQPDSPAAPVPAPAPAPAPTPDPAPAQQPPAEPAQPSQPAPAEPSETPAPPAEPAPAVQASAASPAPSSVQDLMTWMAGEFAAVRAAATAHATQAAAALTAAAAPAAPPAVQAAADTAAELAALAKSVHGDERSLLLAAVHSEVA